ncbi:unnamed protein product [Owenia fusiformis]|uniref:Uncharacterized protein n=1 Tax=Owenia fusiformis TaxID=6347 RepID=A0A8J1U155_OWEFU|nr:unnamed protein product [Owenia fusiformis]
MKLKLLILTVIATVGFPSRIYADIEFLKNPEPTAVIFGHDTRFDCSAIDVPENRPISYLWYFNGDHISVTLPKASVFQNQSLYIPKVNQEALGIYQCQVSLAGISDSTKTSQEATLVEAFINKDFYENPGNITTQDGNITELRCITPISAPPFSVSWEKDGQPFTKGSQVTAIFGDKGDGGAARVSVDLQFKTSLELQGVYRCVAVNLVTKQTVRSYPGTVSVTLITKRPYFETELPRSVMGSLDHPFTVDCHIVGTPTPTITWRRGARAVIATKTIYVFSNGSLHFTQLANGDSGQYSCIGSNSEGTVRSRPVRISAASIGLVFKTEPIDVVAVAGRSGSLLCQPPDSTPPAKIIWYKDNTKFIERQGIYAVKILPSGELFFTNVQLEDAGDYFCVAINEFAMPSTRTSRKAVLTIKASPIFTQPPVPQSIIKGRLLHMICRVSGDPAPSISWYNNNGEITTADPRVTYRDLKQELILNDVNKQDEGTYFCRASNVYGSPSSPQVYVQVIVPPEIIDSVEDEIVSEGFSILMKCGVYGDPTPSVTWYKDGIELKPLPSHMSMLTNGLSIYPVDSSDSGLYRCRAVNIGGVKEREGRLTVQVFPKFVLKPSDRTVNKSQGVVLECVATGSPQPQLTWLFNNSENLPTGVVMSQDLTSLIIRNIQEKHAGKFTCRATNVIQTIEASGIITVQVKPLIASIDGTYIIQQNRDLLLTCVARGDPSPGFQWYKGRKLLTHSLDSRVTFPQANQLLVKYMRKQDAGIFTCVAHNAAGLDELDVAVYVRDPPRPPVLLTPFAISTRSINVTWVPVQQDVNNNVSYFVVQYREDRIPPMEYLTYRDDIHPDMTSLELGGLRPATLYLVRMAARNEVGQGQFGSELVTKTYETAPSMPRNMRLVKGGPREVDVAWEMPEFSNGQIRTYQVHIRLSAEEEFRVSEIEVPTLPLQRWTLKGLHPYRMYQVKVRGATIQGTMELWGNFSDLMSFNTSMAEPDTAPSGVNVTVLSNTSFHIQWKKIPFEDENGPIREYKVIYTDLLTSVVYSKTVDATRTNISHSLHPWREYSIQVFGYNDVGSSPGSATHIVKTLPGVPTGAPADVNATALTSSDIFIQWKELELTRRNSIISGYDLQYKLSGSGDNYTSVFVNATIFSYLISGLLPYTSYDIRLRSFTDQIDGGLGPFTDLTTVETLQDLPGPVANVVAISSSYSVTLSWEPPLLPNGIVTSYNITYKQIPVPPPKTSKYFGNELKLRDSYYSPGAKQAWLDPQIKLSPGRLSKWSIMVHPGIIEDTPARLQIWQVVNRELATGQFKLVWEKEVLIRSSAGQQEFLLNDTEQFTVNAENRVGWQFETDLGPISYEHSLGHDIFFLGIKDGAAPIIGNSYQFLRKPSTIFSIGVDVEVSGNESSIITSNPSIDYNTTYVMATENTSVVIDNLLPSSRYRFTVVAETAAGLGPVAVETTAKTLTLTTQVVTTDAPTSESDVTTDALTTALQTSPPLAQGLSERDVPIVIGASVVGGLVLIIIVAVIVYFCCRHRRQKQRRNKPIYFVPPPSAIPTERSVAAGTQASTRDPDATIDQLSTDLDYDPTPEIEQRPLPRGEGGGHHRGEGRAYPRSSQSSQEPSSRQYRSDRGDTYNEDYETIQELEVTSTGITGISNPGFRASDLPIERPPGGSDVVPTVPTDPVYAQVDRAKKNRMRSRSAAAIAAQRNRASALYQDTDSLVNNESVVVYDERTAL